MATQDRYLCTVEDTQAIAPCLKCLSRKELYALMVVIMAEVAEYSLPAENDKLLADSACFNCLSDREKLNGVVASLVAEYRDGVSIDTLREQIKCVLCWDEQRLKSALALLFCAQIRDSHVGLPGGLN